MTEVRATQSAEAGAGSGAGPDADIPASVQAAVPEPAAPPPPPPTSLPRKRRSYLPHSFLGFLFALVLGFAALVAALGLTGTSIRMPVWVVAEVETRLNRSVDGMLPEGALSLGGIEIGFDADWVPRLRLDDLRVQNAAGKPLLTLPETGITFDLDSLLEGAVRPRNLRISGARVDLRRDAEGRFDLALGSGQLGAQIDGIPALFDLVDAAFALPVLSRLQSIEADALALSLRDDRSRRTWEVGDGRLRLENRARDIRAELGISMLGASGQPAQAVLTIISDKTATEARITATVDQVAAVDIADQAPLLAALRVLDAPISGRLAATLGAEGITALDASLTLGKGALRPTQAAAPVPFDRATLELVYDPDRGRMKLTTLNVESPSLRIKAVGQSYLQSADGTYLTGPLGSRLPQAFATQIHVSEAMVDPAGLFEKPVRFSEGAIDLRLRLDPFKIDIGQISLIESGHRLSAKGTVGAGDDGWTAAVDSALDEITTDNLLQLWPVSLVPNTRKWLAENVLQGRLSDVRSALRVQPGKPTRLQMGYDFSKTEVRFIRTLPPIVRASGYATIEGQTYTMVLSKGVVTPPLGGDIDMAGSVFSVLDITRKPAQAEVRLKTRSTLTAALSILDEPPFRFLTKANRPVEIGEGQATLDAVLRFPLIPRIMPGDVSFAVNGRVAGFSSAQLVRDKLVTAPDLSVSADPKGLRIAGQGAVGRVPFGVTFWQPFGPDAAGKARIEGTAELSPLTVSEFNLGLPEAMVRGTGQAQVTIELPKGAAPRLSLVSDLNRISMAIPGTGWSKAADVQGRLAVSAVLSQPPVVDSITLDAPGLAASGSISLRGDGGLDVARFGSVSLGDWFAGGVEITGRGAGKAVSVALTGGAVDIRKMDTGTGTGTGGDGGAGADIPITARLDEVRISDDLRLTGFAGRFTPRGGFNGSFDGLVNGIAAVTGTVVPSANGAAVRIRSENAGAVLDSAGVFASARGGTLDMLLTPAGPPGVYAGSATITRVRVANAPVLAELLSAVSVVGLLEQLNGEGLLFNEAVGDFTVTPGAVQISRASAVGASLGVSMAGVYGTTSKEMHLQGVVSPLYLLNGIGSFLTKRGEGFFGFNYEVNGDASGASVSVNPLSILTPGRFRELFRSPPPRLGDNGG
ncbi:hypothetical protein HYN69_07755 [Gemmobacter aquarius]|uniref:AsmA-like C-terminal region n=1 Tax=Paragemmobacter aquarius TaxID=2169400 RepID=A0A2S0UKU1_9RHOB|nr:DUF3971 domain-containing protein [Gemmobacter aquarius]AWB48422.1 hypothetical protein HYN69_07755 [Gemmobacter aquarius]